MDVGGWQAVAIGGGGYARQKRTPAPSWGPQDSSTWSGCWEAAEGLWGRGPGSQDARVDSCPCPFLSVMWVNHLTSLSLSFVICTRGILTGPISPALNDGVRAWPGRIKRDSAMPGTQRHLKDRQKGQAATRSWKRLPTEARDPLREVSV